jgi:3'-phosphoadenosine 5'-phosphosulfate sulfotransferase (PAPS reductase)/FAD synthetase
MTGYLTAAGKGEGVTINYCGFSGGKDSQTVGLWLVHESGVPRESIRFTFCDTSNEHQFTYDHIQLLSAYFQAQGCSPVVTLKPERGFFELARWKRRFPSRRARFCTQFLKVIPSREDVMALIRADHEVIVHSGVRAGESLGRAKLVERGFDDMFGCVVNRPLLRWTLPEVLAYNQRFNLPLNPLYSYGMSRVGCFPCINSRKSEIKLISIHFPERIDQLRSQELQFNGVTRNISTFFAPKTVPERFRTHEITTNKGARMNVATIDDVVRWSRTGKRAREIQPYLSAEFDDDATLACPGGQGMCE